MLVPGQTGNEDSKESVGGYNQIQETVELLNPYRSLALVVVYPSLRLKSQKTIFVFLVMDWN